MSTPQRPELHRSGHTPADPDHAKELADPEVDLAGGDRPVCARPRGAALAPHAPDKEVAMARDAVELIKEDHQRVEALFREYEQAGDRAHKTKKRLADEISRELEVHAQVEEESFYPAVGAKAKKDGKELVHEAVEEHHLVRVTLAELAELDPEDESFDAKVQVLMENVRHHVQEEESEMLPQATELLGEEALHRLGEEMRARKRQLGAV
jgi:hemerythrin superfamily protein